MLLAENLLLLVTDDASGRLYVPTDQLDPALAGANLIQLTMMGRVDLSGEGAGSAGKPGRLIVCDPSPAGDEVLDAALRIVLERTGRKPSAVVRPLGKDLRRTRYERLGPQALVQQAAPEPASAALIALVHALKCEHKIVGPGLSKRQLRARAEQI